MNEETVSNITPGDTVVCLNTKKVFRACQLGYLYQLSKCEKPKNYQKFISNKKDICKSVCRFIDVKEWEQFLSDGMVWIKTGTYEAVSETGETVYSQCKEFYVDKIFTSKRGKIVDCIENRLSFECNVNDVQFAFTELQKISATFQVSTNSNGNFYIYNIEGKD